MTYGACLRMMLFVTGLPHPPPRHSSDFLMESSPRARQPQFDPLGKRTLMGVGEITRLFSFIHINNTNHVLSTYCVPDTKLRISQT